MLLMDDSTRWWSEDTVAVVTGANKGIGFEIARQLARQGLRVVLTARNEGRGKKALEALNAEGLTNVAFHTLNVGCEESAHILAKWLFKNYGGINILVNNAGIFATGVDADNAELIMQTNYYGSKQVIKAMLPILRSTDCAGPRILIVASRCGQLKALENNFREKFLDREHITEAYIDNFVNKYLDEVKSGAWEGGGWPDWTKWGWISPMPTYSVSKIALIAYSSVLHQAFSTQPAAAGQQKICIFSYCPGNVKTDMNDHRGKLSVEEGADTGVWLVLQCPEGSSGKFWAERQEMDF